VPRKDAPLRNGINWLVKEKRKKLKANSRKRLHFGGRGGGGETPATLPLDRPRG